MQHNKLACLPLFVRVSILALALARPLTAEVSPQVPLMAVPFALSQVRLLDGPFRDAMMRDKEYLLGLDADRLLHTFRLNAGLASKAKPYGGWEEPRCELRGHSLGHYLSACSLMYASTGDESLKSRVSQIIGELAKCQQAAPKQGFHEGYLSAFPESFIDRVEACKPVWAPWYTLHKIMAGLLDAHQLCGNQEALEILRKMADWIKFRVDHLTAGQMQASLNAEFGGMNEALANLYAVTGQADHLRLAQAFDHQRLFQPLAKGEDRLDGLHANTQIPKMIGAAREYEMTGDQSYRDIAACFWDRVANHRSYAVGGHSDFEHFFPIDQFAGHLGTDTCESCNTYNMLKLTRHLFQWEPSGTAMDFYERALYNHILASQDPKTGMFVYFMSLKPGHFKTYSLPEDSFWCCVGTGMENHAKYGDSIYFHDEASLYVNLFISSELNWPENNLVVRQETRFPMAGNTRLTLKCGNPVRGALKIRHPAWAPSLGIAVNGQKTEVKSAPGGYASLERQWIDGDIVEVDFSMTLRTEPLPGTTNLVAFLYGPIVLAGELGTSGLPSPYARSQVDLGKVPTPQAPLLVAETGELLSHISKVPDQPLTFRTRGIGRPGDFNLVPLYQLHHQRYAVYWPVYSERAWDQKRNELAVAEAIRNDYERRLVDEVRVGESPAETDHRIAGADTRSGEFQGRKWRDAHQGGWFSYEVKVLAKTPMTLLCTFWGSDAGEREFDILVDEEKVASQKLSANQPGEFFDVAWVIPEKLAQGKDHLTVKFQAHPGKMAGGLFGLRVLRPSPTPQKSSLNGITQPLWPALAPLGDGSYEETQSSRITVYQPAPEKATGAAVVICPGGGYGGLMMEPEGHGIARWLAGHGLAGIVLEYRLPAGRSLVPLLDAQRALRTARTRAAEWKLDPRRIGIMGFSAGGHLAATAGTHFDGGNPAAADPIARESSRPDFMILVYPVITMQQNPERGSKRNLLGENPRPEWVEWFSNEKQVTRTTPPAFLAHALDDTVVLPSDSRMFYEALRRESVPAQFLELPRGGHGLNGYQGPMWDAWQNQSLAWLKEIGMVSAPATKKVPRIVVWDERQPQQKSVYPNWLGNHLADHLRSAGGLDVQSVALDDPGQGLLDLDNCDVLVWWGHVRHAELKPELAGQIVRRIEAGKLSLLALHASHWSQPFVQAMRSRARADALNALAPDERSTAILAETNLFTNFYTVPKYTSPRTPFAIYRKPGEGPVQIQLFLPNCCFPAYRADGKSSQVRVVNPSHPIARGLSGAFTIGQTEMYDEPFHVPPPDEVVLEERWASGEWFRSGMVWNLGQGRVFYFRPGHETYPVFKNPEVLKVVENAVRWLAEKPR